MTAKRLTAMLLAAPALLALPGCDMLGGKSDGAVTSTKVDRADRPEGTISDALVPLDTRAGTETVAAQNAASSADATDQSTDSPAKPAPGAATDPSDTKASSGNETSE